MLVHYLLNLPNLHNLRKCPATDPSRRGTSQTEHSESVGSRDAVGSSVLLNKGGVPSLSHSGILLFPMLRRYTSHCTGLCCPAISHASKLYVTLYRPLLLRYSPAWETRQMPFPAGAAPLLPSPALAPMRIIYGILPDAGTLLT